MDSCTPGTKSRLLALLFDPAEGKPDSGSDIEVLFNGVATKPDPGIPSDTRLIVKVPPGLTGQASGQMSITVKTSAGVLTPTPFTGLKIEGPRITSLKRDGTTIFVDVYGLDFDSSLQISVKDSTNTPVAFTEPVNVADGETGKFKFNLRQETSPPYTVSVTVNETSSSMAVD